MALATCLVVVGITPNVHAQGKKAGAWLTVPNPLTESGRKNLEAETARAMKADNGRPKRIVYHFKDAARADYAQAYALAQFLRNEVQGNHEMVAFVEGDLTGHAVLPLLTFRRIFLGGNAGFGAVEAEQARGIEKSQQDAYVAAGDFGSKDRALVMKMLYPGLALYRKADGGGFRIHGDFDKYEISPEQRKQLAIGDDERRNLKPVMDSGTPGMFRGKADAIAFGLAEDAELTSKQVVNLLELDDAVLRQNPVAGATKLKAGWIEVRGNDGVIDGGTKESVISKIDRAVGRENCNYLIFVIEVGGGPNSITPALDIAKRIAEVSEKAMTIAFVPTKATGAAMLVAFSCHEIVMGDKAAMNARELVFQPGPVEKAKPFPEKDLDLHRKRFEEVMQGRIEGLPRALLDPKPEMVYAALNRGQKGFPQERFLTMAEFNDKGDDQKPRWSKLADLKKSGELLELTTRNALNWGLVQKTAKENSKAALGELYGIEPENIVSIEQSFLDKLAEILRHPMATVFLVIVGFTCLLLELKSPGVSLPAIIAALCFILVFWAHSTLAGEVLSLAVLLFLLGLILLGIELFVLPGFGVAGISGIVLMLVSLTLIMVRNWPSSTEQWMTMLTYLGIFGAGLLGAMIAAYTLAKYLPQIPYANRLVLQPPVEEAGEAVLAGETLSQAAALLGATGVAVTELRPAGKARIGDQYLDVAAEGAFVAAGAKIQVIEIHGTHIIVKALGGTEA